MFLSICIPIIPNAIKRVDIKQEYEQNSVCRDEWYVRTKIETYTWCGMPNTLEYYEWTYCHRSQIDSILLKMKTKSIPIYSKIINCNY